MSQQDAGDETLVPKHALQFAPRAQRSAPRLRWSDSGGAHHVTIHERITAGTASGNGVVIADPTVSRLHAELENREDGLWIRDLGSKNGTFVEGVLVSAARVPEGGKLRLGSTDLVLERDPDPWLVELWPSDRFGPLVGASTAMRELFAQLARVAKTEASVLIQGETGTGKELVARAIHEESPRGKQPFIVIDCAALTPTLLESELFGHAKGSFTGATGMRVGAIEAAHGGTVFLDEIGELPISMQPRLLRVLESRTVRRVGETQHREVDVRFLSATHRDLRTMVNAGAFREDLYFRLAVLPITIPALRDRREDIPRLFEHFLGSTASPELGRELASRPWLGNVRELRNFVERAKALGVREALALEDGARAESSPSTRPAAPATIEAVPDPFSVPPPAPAIDAIDASRPFREAREACVDAFEREYVRKILERHAGNVSEAAQAAGVDRTYVYRLIRKHGLQ